MSRFLLFPVALCVALFSGGGCSQPQTLSTDSATPVAPKHLMSELVRTQYSALLESLAEEPASDEQWEQSAAHAALLTEAGNILIREGAPLDEPWRLAAKALHEGGQSTKAAIDARDLTGARQSFEALNDSCATCHRECSAAYALPWR